MAALRSLDDATESQYHVIKFHRNDALYYYHGRPVRYGDIRAFVFAAFIIGVLVGAVIITSVLTW